VIFFATAMPILVYALSVVFYGSSFDFNGKPFGVVVAAGMITWGGAVTGFVNLPEAVLQARERGELKRLRGTPLPPILYLAGRSLAAVAWSLLTAVLLVAIGVTLFDLRVSGRGLLLAGALLVLGVVTMAAVGSALGSFLPSVTSATAVALGILLPLGFFSGVFPVAGAPSWMGTVGSSLPLKPIADGISTALSPAADPVPWTALGVTVGWLVLGALVSIRRFGGQRD
jgi:ABC-type multidrug transport system permease subunit